MAPGISCEKKFIILPREEAPNSQENYICRCCLKVEATGDSCWGRVDT